MESKRAHKKRDMINIFGSLNYNSFLPWTNSNFDVEEDECWSSFGFDEGVEAESSFRQQSQRFKGVLGSST